MFSNQYQSKDEISGALPEYFEFLLAKAYEEENPFQRFDEQEFQMYGPNTLENPLAIEERERRNLPKGEFFKLTPKEDGILFASETKSWNEGGVSEEIIGATGEILEGNENGMKKIRKIIEDCTSQLKPSGFQNNQMICKGDASEFQNKQKTLNGNPSAVQNNQRLCKGNVSEFENTQKILIGNLSGIQNNQRISKGNASEFQKILNGNSSAVQNNQKICKGNASEFQNNQKTLNRNSSGVQSNKKIRHANLSGVQNNQKILKDNSSELQNNQQFCEGSTSEFQNNQRILRRNSSEFQNNQKICKGECHNNQKIMNGNSNGVQNNQKVLKGNSSELQNNRKCCKGCGSEFRNNQKVLKGNSSEFQNNQTCKGNASNQKISKDNASQFQDNQKIQRKSNKFEINQDTVETIQINSSKFDKHQNFEGIEKNSNNIKQYQQIVGASEKGNKSNFSKIQTNQEFVAVRQKTVNKTHDNNWDLTLKTSYSKSSVNKKETSSDSSYKEQHYKYAERINEKCGSTNPCANTKSKEKVATKERDWSRSNIQDKERNCSRSNIHDKERNTSFCDHLKEREMAVHDYANIKDPDNFNVDKTEKENPLNHCTNRKSQRNGKSMNDKNISCKCPNRKSLVDATQNDYYGTNEEEILESIDSCVYTNEEENKDAIKTKHQYQSFYCGNCSRNFESASSCAVENLEFFDHEYLEMLRGFDDEGLIAETDSDLNFPEDEVDIASILEQTNPNKSDLIRLLLKKLKENGWNFRNLNTDCLRGFVEECFQKLKKCLSNKNLNRDKMNDSTKGDLKGLAKRGLKDSTKDNLKQGLNDTNKENLKNLSKQRLKDTTKEKLNNLSNEALKDTTKEESKLGFQVLSKETLKQQGLQNSSKEELKDLPKHGSKEKFKDSIKPGLKEATKAEHKKITNGDLKEFLLKRDLKEVINEDFIKDLIVNDLKNVINEKLAVFCRENPKELRKEELNDLMKEFKNSLTFKNLIKGLGKIELPQQTKNGKFARENLNGLNVSELRKEAHNEALNYVGASTPNCSFIKSKVNELPKEDLRKSIFQKQNKIHNSEEDYYDNSGTVCDYRGNACNNEEIDFYNEAFVFYNEENDPEDNDDELLDSSKMLLMTKSNLDLDESKEEFLKKLCPQDEIRNQQLSVYGTCAKLLSVILTMNTLYIMKYLIFNLLCRNLAFN